MRPDGVTFYVKKQSIWHKVTFILQKTDKKKSSHPRYQQFSNSILGSTEVRRLRKCNVTREPFMQEVAVHRRPV